MVTDQTRNDPPQTTFVQQFRATFPGGWAGLLMYLLGYGVGLFAAGIHFRG